MRTVRSAAQARNRPRTRLAWLLIAIVAALIALAARATASPAAPTAPSAPDDDQLTGRALDAALDDAGAFGDAAVRDDGADAGALEPDNQLSANADARPPRPSRWGQLELSLTWRRRLREPADALGSRGDELWLVAEWRR